MTVPKAAVDEYGNSLAGQNNIGAAGQILVIAFLAIPKRPHEPTDNALGGRVPGLYAPHDAATLGCGEFIHVFWKSNPPGGRVQCPLM